MIDRGRGNRKILEGGVKGRFKRCPSRELPTLGIDNMIRALFSSRLEIYILARWARVTFVQNSKS